MSNIRENMDQLDKLAEIQKLYQEIETVDSEIDKLDEHITLAEEHKLLLTGLEILPLHFERLLDLDLRKQIEHESILEKGENLPPDYKGKIIYTVKDLETIFDFKRDKALMVMHLMQRMGYALKLGKEFYTTKEKLLEFMNTNMGEQLLL